MSHTIAVAACLAVLFALFAVGAAGQPESSGPPLAHMVFFTLKEDTPENRAALVAACHEHLSGHEGTLYFSVGTLAAEFDREVNDRDYHIALHLVFADRAAHDRYQPHPRHVRFIEENRHLWETVRVFDSWLVEPNRK